MTDRAVTKATARHYTWGDGCDGWHLADEPGLAVIQERMPPGTAETRHVHERATQFFFVLAGRATIVAGEEEIPIAPGHGLTVPPGVPHTVRNADAEPLEFIVVSAPPTRHDRRDVATAGSGPR